MSQLVPTRRAYTSVLAGLMLAVLHLSAIAQPPKGGQSALPPPPRTEWRYPSMNHSGRGPHLQQWMQSHSNLTPTQQQQALDREPGFRELPPETQQKMHDRLRQLNNMSPEQRQRLLERNEALARLSPSQRQQVRDTMRQFSSLPPDRRREVARAFHELRQVPESERQNLINSGRYRNEFSDEERSALSNLFAVEPYHVIRPHPGPNDPPAPDR